MITKTVSPLTPLSVRADRSSPDVRIFEEAVIALRGRWPATATGLCVEANALFGFSLSRGTPGAQERAFRACVDEALRLLEALDGPSAVERVRSLASREPEDRHTARARRALRLRFGEH